MKAPLLDLVCRSCDVSTRRQKLHEIVNFLRPVGLTDEPGIKQDIDQNTLKFMDPRSGTNQDAMQRAVDAMGINPQQVYHGLNRAIPGVRRLTRRSPLAATAVYGLSHLPSKITKGAITLGSDAIRKAVGSFKHAMTSGYFQKRRGDVGVALTSRSTSTPSFGRGLRGGKGIRYR
jgi:hypothetical protein